MSATKNTEAVANQGAFTSRIPPSEPMTTKGVRFRTSTGTPATLSIDCTDSTLRRTWYFANTVNQHAIGTKVGNDAYPEFQAETHPPGTAPKENSFQPQTQDEVPGQAHNPHTTTRTEALDFPGATSADVHTGLGHPGSGQTSNEPGKKQRSGLEGVGASAVDAIHSKRADVDRDQTAGQTDQPTASERVPTSAETVAAERSYRGA